MSQADVPQPGPGQVRIRVRAVAVNPVDAKIRGGLMDGVFPVRFPVLPGFDVAGVVDAAGEGASETVGAEVFGVAAAGGYAEYALLDHPVAKPPTVSFENAAAVVTVGEAAFRALKHLGLKPGQTLLILGSGRQRRHHRRPARRPPGHRRHRDGGRGRPRAAGRARRDRRPLWG